MTAMKKICLSAVFALVFLSSVVGIKAQTQPSAAAFNGTWVLDKVKTSPKDFPQKLINYKVIVGESENLLNVKSQSEGKVEVEVSRDRVSRNIGVGDNTAGRGASPPASGVAVASSRSVEAEKPNYGGTLALYYTPNEVTYNLNGEEQKVEIRQGEKVNGIARIKAKLDKSGKSLQFSTIRRMRTNLGEIEITMRETWKLSDDGKSIKLVRTVETPTARDQITMILTKPAQ